MSRVLPRETAAEVDAGNPRCAVLPVGSFEQHGPFLPLITDTVVASVIAGRARAGIQPVRPACRSRCPARMSTTHGARR